MGGGGEREEAERWLRNFVASHAKRESPQVETSVALSGSGDQSRYSVSLGVGERRAPSPGEAPLELSVAEIAQGQHRLAWCEGLAARVRGMARGLLGAEGMERRSA
jgi:hypothetical protein